MKVFVLEDPRGPIYKSLSSSSSSGLKSLKIFEDSPDNYWTVYFHFQPVQLLLMDKTQNYVNLKKANMNENSK